MVSSFVFCCLSLCSAVNALYIGRHIGTQEMKGKPSWAQRALKGNVCNTPHVKSGDKFVKRIPSWASRSGAHSVTSPPKTAVTSPPKQKRAWSMNDLERKINATSLPEWWISAVLRAAPAAMTLSLLYGVEFFSGEGQLAAACCFLIGAFGSYDIKHGPSHDLLKESGLHNAIVLLLRVSAGGYAHFGTPCKSWIVLSRSWTRRSILRPQGPKLSSVSPARARYLKMHNEIATRSVLLIKTARALGIWFTLEQPVSSLLFGFCPEILVGCKSAAFGMGQFGGDSPKPLKLVGTAPWLHTFRQVYLLRTSRMKSIPLKRLTHKEGKSFTGKQSQLVDSAGYTKCFGHCIALCVLGLNAEDVYRRLQCLDV